MYSRTIVFILLSLLCRSLNAQDAVNFTQFFFNPYSINPSYAGIDGRPSIALAYRKQWATIDSGPTIVNFSFHAPASKRVALGLNVLQDTRGLLSNTGLLISVGYNFPLASQSFIRFGVSGGASWNKIDLAKLDGFSDNAIAKILDNNTYLLGNAGMSLHVKSFHAGVSLPLLFKPAYVSQDAFTVTEVKPFQAFIVQLSNRFYFNKNKNVFEPYILYRVNTGLPSQFEFAGVVHLNHVLYVGSSYKQDFGISVLGGIKLKNTLGIGASYTLKNSGVNELNSPTYEVHLGYLLGAHRKESAVYSFVNTLKEKEKKSLRKSASELVAEKRQQDELARKKKANEPIAKKPPQNQVQKKQGTALVQKQKEPEKMDNKKLATPTVRPDSVPGKHKPRFDHVSLSNAEVNFEVTEHTPEDEKERISRLTLHANNPKETHDAPSNPNGERHEFANKGTHPDELNVTNYVIGGVFKDQVTAKRFADGLQKLSFKAGYGYSSGKVVWYVYVFKANDINKTREERDKLRKTKILRDCWLLSVQN